MAGSRGPTVRRRRLGGELRRLREAAGVTIEQAADLLRCTDSKISRMERGHSPFRARDVTDLLAHYGGTTDSERTALLALATETRKPGWWHSYGDAVPRWFEIFIGLEADASSICCYQAQLVEGLLQTPDYARALIRGTWPDTPEAEVESKVKVRLDRQKILDDAQPPDLWVILDEAVLRRPVGSPEVMRKQLEHLAEAADRPGVTIQVLPFAAGAHVAMGSSFTLLGFPDGNGDPEVCYIEELTGSLYLEKPAEVAVYKRKIDHLRAAAYDGATSARMLAKEGP